MSWFQKAEKRAAIEKIETKVAMQVTNTLQQILVGRREYFEIVSFGN